MICLTDVNISDSITEGSKEWNVVLRKRTTFQGLRENMAGSEESGVKILVTCFGIKSYRKSYTIFKSLDQ